MGLSTFGRTTAVVAFYVGLALFSLRAVLPAPATTAALPADLPPAWQQISDSDQKLLIAQVAFNARALTRSPATLRDGPQCFPLRNASTLGEHAFGLGFLGVVPYLLSGGDPVLTYNAVVVSALVLAGLGMFLLVRAWTGNTAAALVAGTLFATHPHRLTDIQHLFVGGNHWTPFALLAAERLFTRRTWTAAAALGVCVGLQTLESIYPVMALALIGGAYGGWLLVRERRALAVVAVPLAVTLAAVAALASAVFAPYLATRALWGTLGGRATVLLGPAGLAPGGSMFVGTVLGALAVVALADRLRGRRVAWAGDPRLVFLVAGLLVAWAALAVVPIPGLAHPLPSLFTLAGRVLPAFDALRGGGAIVTGVILVAAVLAGFGVAVLTEGRSSAVRAAVTATALAAALVEVFVPALARASFGKSVTLQARLVRPHAALVELYGGPAEGAVLDVPYAFSRGKFRWMGEYVFNGAYHHRPVAACYNSFHVALQDEIAAKAAHVLADPRAADALVALGIRDVVVHPWIVGGRGAVALPVPTPPHLREVGRALARVRYALVSTAPVTRDWALLAAGAAALADDAAPVVVAPGATAVEVRIANGGSATYRQPDPIEPLPVVARWHTLAGALVGEEHGRRYLTAALAAGDTTMRRLALAVPREPGRYRLTIAPASAPDLVVAATLVEVRA